MENQSSSHINWERGQSFVELAVSLVFLLTLLSFIVEAGRMAYIYVALHEAAEEGAVYASFCPPKGLTEKILIENHVRNSSHEPLNLRDANIQVAGSMLLRCWPSDTYPPCSPGDDLRALPGEEVRVTVSFIGLKPITPFAHLALQGAGINLSATARDVAVQFSCP